MKFIFIIAFSLPLMVFGQKITGVSLEAPSKEFKSTAFSSVKKVNAEWVAAIPFGFLKKDSTAIKYNHKYQWWGETPAGIIKTIAMAKQNGLKVMLKPQLWISNQFVGHIDFTENPKKWKELESNYELYILKFAQIADSMDVDLFSIGCEFKTWVVKRPVFWKGLIKKIRSKYHGKLTYSANWDNVGKVPFWHLLDYVGVDSYFPMSKAKTPSVTELKSQWKQTKNLLHKQYMKFGKKILFTEYGFRSVDFNMEETWDSEKPGKVNQLAQDNAYKVFFQVMYQEKWFAGGFLWKWKVNHATAGGPKDNRFTPQNKLAEKTISNFFSEINKPD